MHRWVNPLDPHAMPRTDLPLILTQAFFIRAGKKRKASTFFLILIGRNVGC